MNIVVLDYDSGNVHSVCRALERAGANVSLTADQRHVMEADGLVVPGVGAFGAVMDKLRAVRGDRFIERRIAGGQPVLGICVGLQVLFDSSEEFGSTDGLSQFPGVVRKLDAPVIPHMGWSPVKAGENSVLLNGLDNERFYFLHSLGVHEDPADNLTDPRMTPPTVSWAEHGQRFVAAIESGPLAATQFHPEKSGHAGLALLTNWLKHIKGSR